MNFSTNLSLYEKTEYRCDDKLSQPIRIGEPHPELDTLLDEGTGAVFITAASPYDQKLTDTQNHNRNELLKLMMAIKGLEFYDALGVPPQGAWQPEYSFLVINTDVDTGITLASEFEQYAFVYVAKGEAAKLVLI